MAVALAFAAGAIAAPHATAPISVPDASGELGSPTSNPVTSTVDVTSAGTVGSISVTMVGVTSEAPDDLDVYLSSPSGTKVMLWSDAGGDDTVAPLTSPVDVTFADGGATSLPDEGAVAAGTYKPTNHASVDDFFCAGQTDPAGPFGTSLAAFSGQPASGTWSLVLADDCVGFTSEVTGGWRLTLNAPTAVGVRGLTAARGRNGVVVRWRTATEARLLGFNLYRGRGSKVNARLIRAKAAGKARGATYAVVDRRAARGGTYRLQLVRTDGSRAWAGSVALSASA